MSKTLRLNIMMFLQFFVWGAFFVTMGTYLGVIFKEYEAKGTLNTIIGSAYATQTWAAVFAPLIVGFVADRLFNKEKVNGVLHLLGGAILWWCSTITDSPAEFFWAMLGFFLCYMPTLALVNAITFQNVESVENDFPKIRLWGTIGWIVSGLVVSQSMFGLFEIPLLPGVINAPETNVPLKLAAVVSVIYGFYSFTLPASPPQGRDEPISIARVLGLDAVRLFKNPSYFVFALCSFLICIPLAFYYARTNEFVSNMAFGDRSAGVMALGQVSEIFFMALVPFFLFRLGVKWMLLVGMLAWALRYTLFGLMPSSAPCWLSESSCTEFVTTSSSSPVNSIPIALPRAKSVPVPRRCWGCLPTGQGCSLVTTCSGSGVTESNSTPHRKRVGHKTPRNSG